MLEAQGEPLRLHDDVEIDAPRAGHVRVRVSHCGVCHSDLSLADGTFPSPLPIVLGHEAAGVVDAVGPDVTGLAPGDPVVLTPCPPCGRCPYCVRGEPSLCVGSLGIQTHAFPDGSTGLSRGGERVWRGLNVAAFAEYTVVSERGAVPVPRDVPLDVVCVLGCAVQTGVGAVLNTARVEEGDSVLVLGLGGVGLSVVLGARLAGAAHILVSDPVKERRAAAEALGATACVDPTAEDVAARARELTGIGVDHAFETAGRASLVASGLAATRNGGTTVCVGAPPLDEAIELAPAALFTVTGKRLVGCVLGGSHSLREIPRLVSLWQAGRLDLEALITARRPLAEIDRAFDDLRHQRGVRTVLEL
ncbi:MAG: alcohol dehydrogenase catalytic domain-containing protein [Myxococcota bacterium]|nr:alcohol dehydrogenase catalytic domain-containing protein [Myxococcota bacterium]